MSTWTPAEIIMLVAVFANYAVAKDGAENLGSIINNNGNKRKPVYRWQYSFDYNESNVYDPMVCWFYQAFMFDNWEKWNFDIMTF